METLKVTKINKPIFNTTAPNSGKSVESKTPELPISSYCCLLTIGKAGSGKSSVIWRLRSDIFPHYGKVYDKTFVINPTGEGDILYDDCDIYSGEEALEEVIEEIDYENNLTREINKTIDRIKAQKLVSPTNDTLQIISDIQNSKDIAFLEANIERIDMKTKKAREMRFLLIADDCTTFKWLHGRGSPMAAFIKNRRHRNTDVIISVQRVIDISPDIRSECTDLLLFREISKDDQKTIHKEIASTVIPNLHDFETFYQQNVSLPYEHLLCSKNNFENKTELVVNLRDHYVR